MELHSLSQIFTQNLQSYLGKDGWKIDQLEYSAEVLKEKLLKEKSVESSFESDGFNEGKILDHILIEQLPRYLEYLEDYFRVLQDDVYGKICKYLNDYKYGQSENFVNFDVSNPIEEGYFKLKNHAVKMNAEKLTFSLNSCYYVLFNEYLADYSTLEKVALRRQFSRDFHSPMDTGSILSASDIMNLSNVTEDVHFISPIKQKKKSIQFLPRSREQQIIDRSISLLQISSMLLWLVIGIRSGFKMYFRGRRPGKKALYKLMQFKRPTHAVSLKDWLTEISRIWAAVCLFCMNGSVGLASLWVIKGLGNLAISLVPSEPVDSGFAENLDIESETERKPSPLKITKESLETSKQSKPVTPRSPQTMNTQSIFLQMLQIVQHHSSIFLKIEDLLKKLNERQIQLDCLTKSPLQNTAKEQMKKYLQEHTAVDEKEIEMHLSQLILSVRSFNSKIEDSKTSI